jgi:hypothetical protein
VRKIPSEGRDSAVAIDWRSALPTLVAIFVASRLLLLAVAAVVEAQFPLDEPAKAWSTAPLLTSLTTSDSVYYLGIASTGYHVAPVSGSYHDDVFFPLYPIVVRVASIATLGDVAVAGVLVANAAFMAAMILVYRLTRGHLDAEASMRTVAYLTVAPGAVAFAMAYGESLFLLLAVGAFLAAEQRRYPLMGLLYALATLTRLPGVLLGIALLVQLLMNDGRHEWRRWAWLLAGPVALAAFYGYLWHLTGDPLANLHGQAAWDAPQLAPITGGPMITRAEPLFVVLLAVLLVYAFLFVYARVDRTAPAHVTWAATVFAAVLAGGRILSAPRYLAVGWTFDWWLGARRSTIARIAWPIAWAGAFGIYAFLAFTTQLAP